MLWVYKKTFKETWELKWLPHTDNYPAQVTHIVPLYKLN